MVGLERFYLVRLEMKTRGHWGKGQCSIYVDLSGVSSYNYRRV